MEQLPLHDKRFHFWQQWLFYSSILFALFGVTLALFGNNPLFEPYHRMLAMIFYEQETFPENVHELYKFVMGPMGANIAGFYLLLAYIARYPFKRRERWAQKAIIVAFGAWFIIDAIVSFYYGVLFQVLALHLFVSVPQKALPLIFTWKMFEN
jgi:hypothetical protein